ncbi:hypothetical protein SDC9_129739 [bioreactor metagenome]|uniref:Cyclic nucleotide-binding domain-containing protein n=1 Tax=bioreactor metagenome TaxID=1076179 RepID=A0A645D0H2_9ZZZZ
MEKFKELLAQECSLKLSEELIDKLLAPAETIELKRNEVLIMSGRYDPNIYIVKDGVMRYSYMDGVKEITFVFALPASMMISMHSFYSGLPAFYQIEACCKSTVLRVPQSHYNHLVETSHEFAKWALRYSQGQIYYLEKKDSVVNGNAKERLLSLIQNRPEIMEIIPLKHIASYIGVTQPYLSLLKKKIKAQK